MIEDNNRLISAEEKVEDVQELSLRPKQFSEFIGQEKLKRNLKIYVDAANIRHESIDHVLLYGPPGLGKTTLANVVAREMDVNIKITSGPAIERPGDLAAILTNLEEGDVLFIDEIHRLNRAVEEVLYPAMEDFELDIVIGKGPSARSIRLDVSKFTLVAATTRVGMLSAPLRDRFGIIERLEYYRPNELSTIIQRAAGILDVGIDDESANKIALRSRGTPRIANRLLKRVRDWAQVQKHDSIQATNIQESLDALGIDEFGLDDIDRLYLETLVQKFGGGPVGVETIAASIAEDADTIEDVVEPYLLQCGFIDRTPRGRVGTKLAYQHLGLPFETKTDSTQTSLFD